MDTNFAIVLYNMVREFHSRFASVNSRAMIEDESICYRQHLQTATAHAKLLEILFLKRIQQEIERSTPS